MGETPSRRYKRVEDLEGDQRAAALAGANAVVAAGAGSGKTTVLAARYVRLLEEGRLRDGSRARPRNLLVLTFTRKAAAEMYSRIYGALAEAAALAAGRAAAGEADAAALAEHLAGCVTSFSEARISTFDSFAGTVARSGCARFGLAPDFAVDDGRAGELARRLALGFLLEKRGDEAMRELVAADGFIEVRDLLAEVAVERMPLSSPPDFGAMHAAQEGILRGELGRLRAALLDERAAALDYAGGKVSAGVQAWLDAFAADPDAPPAPGPGAAAGAPDGASEGAPGGDRLLAGLAGFRNLRTPAAR
ncbi:MAG: UvrD-helicase domain-containing protein, partial [Spirochaetaceae bacterium]|nr:UvrD-helicase domain-containing protein [Spirochaetaceae bacterium]